MKKECLFLLRWMFAGVIAASYQLFYPILSPITLRISYGILQFFTDAVLQGKFIYVNGVTLEFVSACAAVSAYTLLWILILLTKRISFKIGMQMALYGSLLILAANILRIELLIYILLAWGKNYFDTLHLFVWTVVSSVYVAAVWLFLTWRFRVKGVPVYSDVKHIYSAVRKK